MAEPVTDPSTQATTAVTNEKDQQHPVQPFRLLDLPTELRLQIYDHLIPEHLYTFHIGDFVYYETGAGKCGPGIIAFLCSCQTVYREALPVLLENSKLQLICWDPAIENSHVHRPLLCASDQFATLRHAPSVKFSVSVSADESYAGIAQSITAVLAMLESCRKVKYLSISILADFGQDGMDSLVHAFMAIECTGAVVCDMSASEEFDRGAYNELVRVLNA